MIAAGHGRLPRAFEGGDGPKQQGAAGQSGRVHDVLEFVVAALREVTRKSRLPGAEHIHGEMAGSLKARQAGRPVSEAPEHQRWLERDGGEGVRRQPAFRSSCGDHGDAGDEPALRAAQAALVQRAAKHGHRVQCRRVQLEYLCHPVLSTPAHTQARSRLVRQAFHARCQPCAAMAPIGAAQNILIGLLSEQVSWRSNCAYLHRTAIANAGGDHHAPSQHPCRSPPAAGTRAASMREALLMPLRIPIAAIGQRRHLLSVPS